MKICNSCNQQFINSEWRCPVCGYVPKTIDNYIAFAPELAETNDGFEADLFPQLAPLEAKNFWFRSRNRLIIWAFKHYFPKAINFLEIGCGTGFVLQGIERAFPKLTLCGSEIFIDGLSFASQRLSRTELFQMDARKIPYYSIMSELKMSGWLNAILEQLLTLERTMIKLGVSFPAGGSLLLVARKL